MDIAAWLRGIGLEEYAPAFRDNRIDMRVLPKLTADDLKELGVTTIGDRRILLDAIAALREPTSDFSRQASTRPSNRSRRGRTASAHHHVLRPGRLDRALGAARPRGPARDHRPLPRVRRRDVRRFDGFVAKYMGDGVLIYFGYPEAHEDDAEQAVRAGLAMVDAVGELEAPEPLQVRIGIATGLVVVGDLIGAGSAQEQAIVGETPNLAARLQALAGPMPSSSPRARAGRSALCSRSTISARNRSRALPSRSAPGACWREPRARPVRGAALGRHAAGRPRRGDWTCCCAAGRRPRRAAGGWC